MITKELEELHTRLQKFTLLLDKAHTYQEKILKLSLNSAWDSLEFMTLNRERLHNIIQKEQESLFTSFENHKKAHGISSEIQFLILAWQHDTSSWIERTKVTDENILVSLREQKSKTSQQISTLFKSKKAHRGYSLKKLTL